VYIMHELRRRPDLIFDVGPMSSRLHRFRCDELTIDELTGTHRCVTDVSAVHRYHGAVCINN